MVIALSNPQLNRWLYRSFPPALTRRPNFWEGLTGCWTPSLGIGQGITTLRDISGFGRDVTMQGGMAIEDWVLSGNPRNSGYCLSLDGSDDFLDRAMTFPATGKYTWLIWSYTGTLRRQWLFSSNTISGGGWGFGCFDANGVLRAYSGGDGTRWTGNNGNFVAGIWQRWVFIYDGSGISNVYVNGVELTPASDSSTTLSGGTEIRIGGRPDEWWDRWNSKWDDARVYNRILTPNEIIDDYTNSNAMFQLRDRFIGKAPAPPEGRTTKNTDAYPLGVNVGMSWRMPSNYL